MIGVDVPCSAFAYKVSITAFPVVVMILALHVVVAVRILAMFPIRNVLDVATFTCNPGGAELSAGSDTVQNPTTASTRSTRTEMNDSVFFLFIMRDYVLSSCLRPFYK